MNKPFHYPTPEEMDAIVREARRARSEALRAVILHAWSMIGGRRAADPAAAKFA